MIPYKHQIEFRHLRYFLAVAEELNFRKAAERLFIAQPGLSRQIKSLEQQLGFPLFERDNRNVQLTTAGQYLQKEVGHLLKHLEEVIGQAQLIDQGREGQVSLSYVGSAMQQVIPSLFKVLREKVPNLHYVLKEMDNPEQIEALLHAEIDLGFVRLEEVPNELSMQTVDIDTFSLVLPKQHPFLKLKKGSLAALKNEPFILFDPSYSPSYFNKVMDLFKMEGFKPLISHQTVHASTIFRLVEQGIGLSVVPSSLRKGYSMDIEFIELNNYPQRTTLSAVWHKDNRNPILNKILAELPSLS